MDVFAIQGNEERLLATGLDAAEVGYLRDWFCSVKPLGEDMIVIARSESQEGHVFRIQVSGNNERVA